jgi:hypothetical protein
VKLRHIFPLLALLLAPTQSNADAIVRTRAMLASTIAEYFVEPGRVRVELEIGLGDLPAFENLLPDEVLRQLGRDAPPRAERLVRFFENDLVIAVEGRRLPGRVVEIGPRERFRRDEITGEVLAPVADEEAETVIFAHLEYALPGRPAQLDLFGPRGGGSASVGFVAYHGAIAVNDFRYISARQRLLLDWGDPFYTRFEVRALRRQYFAPMSGFLYIDAYEVRREIIVRPFELQAFVDLGLDGRSSISPEMQPELLRRAAAFLGEHFPVEIDGVAVKGELARVNFLERSLRTSRVIDPPEELDLHAAMLGAIWVFPTEGLPERATMEWDLWTERTTRIPASSVDQAGPFPMMLEPDAPVLEWQNFLKNPKLPIFAVLQPPPSAVRRALADWGRWGLGVVAVAAVLVALRSRSRGALAGASFACAAAAAAFLAAHGARMTPERTAQVTGGLLHNVYRAFDFRDEETIYDLLAKSADGDLLEQIYLETRRGLELQSQGGARARVETVELIEVDAESAGGGAFEAVASWKVTGSVGHWGHVHQRRNRYRARLRVEPVSDVWKLAELTILEEERL